MEIRITLSKEENEQIKKNKDISKLFEVADELDGLYYIKSNESISIYLSKQESLKLIDSIKLSKLQKTKLSIAAKIMNKINKMDED